MLRIYLTGASWRGASHGQIASAIVSDHWRIDTLMETKGDGKVHHCDLCCFPFSASVVAWIAMTYYMTAAVKQSTLAVAYIAWLPSHRNSLASQPLNIRRGPSHFTFASKEWEKGRKEIEYIEQQHWVAQHALWFVAAFNTIWRSHLRAGSWEYLFVKRVYKCLGLKVTYIEERKTQSCN